MNDLIPLSIFAGCLLATLGLVRVCEWLRPNHGGTLRKNADEARSDSLIARYGEAAR